MITLSANKKFDWNLPLTDKAADVIRAFGITVQRLKNNAVTHQCEIKLSPGQIAYITGPSGSGKSVLLREFYNTFSGDDKINIDDIPLPDDKTCVDCFSGSFLETLRTLSCAGLTDVFCVLNSPATLSEGQKYRYRIAKAIAGDKQYIFADEFCSNLDRVTAAVISYNLRKFAAKTGKTFILASSHDDLLSDLLPQVIVIKHLAGEAEIIYKNI
ncbi:MAG: ATP-binding cassette domain-containing protein [Phycisphaerae bacterium]|jgi:ABC-type ATPase with predicted acetyltransferase domain